MPYCPRYIPIFKAGEKPGTGLSAVDKMNKTLRVFPKGMPVA